MKRDEDDFEEQPAVKEADEPNIRGKELKLFTMCLKKFIKKIFQHMVATRFTTWKEMAIHEQDGLAYPIYNYVIDSSDARLRKAVEATAWDGNWYRRAGNDVILVAADNPSLADVVTTQFISQEIVRSIVATLGLIAAALCVRLR